MNITIKDVAKAAGVSRTTISFYLNGKFQYMSAQTKENIRKVIEELEYKPSSVAKGLKTKKSGLIGMIVADITNPFTSILVKGVNDKCIEKGYQLIVANTDNSVEKEREYIISTLQRQAEGIIVNATGGNVEFLKEIKEKGNKIVLADRTIGESYFDFVTTNNEEITLSTVEMLYNNGFEEVAFFTYPIDINTTRAKRYKSFKEVTSRYKDNPDDYLYVVNSEKDMKDKIKEFNEKYHDKRKAAFIVNGVVLLNFVKGALELGLSIPKDIGVCSFDDWGWNNVVGNGITAISQPSYEVGSKCAEILIQRITGEIESKEPVNLVLESQLIIRGSTQIK